MSATVMDTLRSEMQLRDKQLDAFQDDPQRSYWLAIVRDAMRELYRRTGRPVSAADVREFFEAIPDVPPPTRLRRMFLGAVWKEKGWVPTGGLVKQTTKGCHAREVRTWRWEPVRIDR